MTDAALAGIWVGVLVGGGVVCALLYRWGLPRTYVRDVLHVGAGVWVFGWPFWPSPFLPSLIPFAAVLLLRALPRLNALRRFREAVSDEDERWSGIVLYALSFAVMTPIGLLWAPFPAAAGLLALSLGDGVGGLIGRRFGRIRYRLPFAKTKSLEGSLAVFLAAAAGIALAARWFGVEPGWVSLTVAAAVAAVAEAVSPRASDNVLIPAAVFLALWL